MTDNFEPTPNAEVMAPPAPIGERFVDVFTAPVKAMKGVAERPAWVIPCLVLFAIMALYTAANVHIMVPEQSEMSLAFASNEQAAGLEQQIEMFLEPPLWLRLVAGIGAGLTVVIFTILIPGLLMHLFLKLSGGVAQAGQTLGVVFWSGLIAYGLRTILGWIIIVVTGSARHAGLTATSFMSDPNPQSVPYMLAGLYGDPFMYWMMFVVVLGLAIVHRLEFSRVAIVAVATYVLLSAIPIGFTLLGQAFSGR